MRRFLWIVLFALSGALLPSAAGAQHLTIDDVRNMALDRGSQPSRRLSSTTISGRSSRDAGGHKIEMKVDALSGEIVKMRRND